MISKLFQFQCVTLALIAILSSPAFAVYELCGNGVDDDASGGDLACPSPDADGDLFPTTGYTSVAGVGIDCDDTNRRIFPGAFTNSGCAANEVRKCQTDGTYTACTAYSALAASPTFFGAGFLHVYILDPTKTADTGSGTAASPWPALAPFNPALATYHEPVAGDMFVYKTGTWPNTTKFTPSDDQQIYLVNKDCTLANPCGFFFDDGFKIVSAGADSAPGDVGGGPGVQPLYVDGSDYWVAHNYKEDGGFATNAIALYTAAHWTFYNPEVINMDGNEDNNLAGFKIAVNSSDIVVYGGTFHDNYERDDAEAVNNSQSYNILDSEDIHIYGGVVYGGSTHHSHGFQTKHTKVGATASTVMGLSISNVGQNCIFTQMESVTFSNIRMADCGKDTASLSFSNRGCDGGAACRNKAQVLRYSLVYGSPAHEFNPDESAQPVGIPALTVTDNVFIDTRAIAYQDDGATGLVRVDNYGSDANYNAVVGTGALVQNRNCYYNTNAVSLLFDYFGDNATKPGIRYTNFAAYKASNIGGWDAGSFNEDPDLTSAGVPQSANCTAMSWRTGVFTASGSSSSTGATIGAVNQIINRRRRR